MAMPGWAKGVAFLNGFNLGWYWPKAGPQMTLYIPGPMLRDGENELILLEVEESVEKPTGQLVHFCYSSPGRTGQLQAAICMVNKSDVPSCTTLVTVPHSQLHC